jgi:hypothetical protein
MKIDSGWIILMVFLLISVVIGVLFYHFYNQADTFCKENGFEGFNDYKGCYRIIGNVMEIKETIYRDGKMFFKEDVLK